MQVDKHNDDIWENFQRWKNKPSLQKSYRVFYENIASHIKDVKGCQIVELGSGTGNIKEVIPDCIRTDLFPNPWVDQIENAYKLSFIDESISNLILFDVFHHLRYPGAALREALRVCIPGGRLIIFEPCLSMLGLLVYGPFHPEPLSIHKAITWYEPEGWTADEIDYYAAQGNASRVFLGQKYHDYLDSWEIICANRFSAISYIASGGYSMPKLYPDFAYPLMHSVDKVLDSLPSLFATRLLVVLEKKIKISV